MPTNNVHVSKLADGSLFALFRVYAKWFYTIVSADGRHAVYSRPYATEREARIAAMLCRTEIALREPAGAIAAAEAADGA